jgi:hypothetical protein
MRPLKISGSGKRTPTENLASRLRLSRRYLHVSGAFQRQTSTTGLEETMSTYANGTQQTYQQIWASMERSCAGMTMVLRTGAPKTVAVTPEATPAAIEWPGGATSGHSRKHPLRTPRRSARGRRRIAARMN